MTPLPPKASWHFGTPPPSDLSPSLPPSPSLCVSSCLCLWGGLQTVFVLQIRSAAAETKDPLFTFGAGVDRRQCCFKFVFQKLMEDLQVMRCPGLTPLEHTVP